MPRPNADEYFLSMLKLVASRGTCARRKVGAILVSDRNTILATGYNGVPSGIEHCVSVPCEGVFDLPGDSRNCLAVHAEINALIQCDRLDLARTLYTSCVPCFACGKAIANTSSTRVVALGGYSDTRSVALLTRVGIKLIVSN